MLMLKRCFASSLLAILFALPSITLGQEVEPNNTCPDAQDVGAQILPFMIAGSLDSVEGAPDIDFFRFTGTPGDLVRADHQGAFSGNGTLGDPFLGLFDTDCILIDINDDTGGPDSRLIFRVPGNGTYVLAATVCCDPEFLGGGQGTYLLTVSPVQVADSITGRLVNARDGAPVSGDSPTFALVDLLRCTDGFCFEFVGFQQADSNGNFRFDSDINGNPLLAGAYRIQASANGFDFLSTDVFELAENQALELGDIAMTPLSLIGSVSGRLVDAIDGTPLLGFGPPFAFAELQRCEGPDCFGVAGTPTDDQGRFRFDGVVFSLAPGRYRVLAFAEDYEPATTLQFDVAENEEVEIGDLGLSPFPIQFGAIEACEIPPGGGLCEYGIELQNRGPGRFKGEAWSTVDFFPNEFPARSSRFQVGRVGTSNPMPVRLNMSTEQTVSLRFQLDVPGSVPDNSIICATATVGTDPHPQFHNLGDRFLFCAATQSGNFVLLSDKEGRKRMRELKQQQLR